MKFVYNKNIMYGILSTILFIIALPFIYVAGLFQPKISAGMKEKLGFNNAPDYLSTTKCETILFYAVSVGEVIAITNLVNRTRHEFPNAKIVVMTGTPTGQITAQQKLGKVANFITYFPYDFPPFINLSMSKIKPDVILMMETELWPNFANYAKNKKIPLYIINGRISDRTFNSYKKLSFFFEPILKCYSEIWTQSKQDRDKLVEIGANPDTTTVMGNLKFDIKKLQSDMYFGGDGHRIIVAGSTHTGEDEVILNAFKYVKREVKDIKLLIAPRHPERNETVFNLCQRTGFKCGKRSQNASFDDCDIILLDSMGELGKSYAVAYFAIMGGSFNQTGGHNPLEATIYNKPVISGPSIHNFKDIYGLLTYTKAGKIVQDQAELQDYMRKMLVNADLYSRACFDCEKVFDQNKGAIDFVINKLKSLW